MTTRIIRALGAGTLALAIALSGTAAMARGGGGGGGGGEGGGSGTDAWINPAFLAVAPARTPLGEPSRGRERSAEITLQDCGSNGAAVRWGVSCHQPIRR